MLTGEISQADHQTYREVPFTVPPGVVRLSVDFTWTAHEQRTVIDLGIFDGERFRGWSGGNKSSFTLAATDATPSFLPGPIKPGQWFLLLGVPNIRPGARSAFTAKIRFDRSRDPLPENTFSAQPSPAHMAWYRGDLHTHTGHSDGSCANRDGVRVPCPVFRTVAAAAERGLDFIAITDHNTNSQYDAMRELQPWFDRVLLLPGREITTFHGHANVFGPVDFIDFRLGSVSVPDFTVLQNQIKAEHGLISINHPMAPSGEDCMGCGWTVTNTDFSRIDAVEAVNGGVAEGQYSGVPFWEGLLNRGFRLTAIGGSDNHDAGKPVTEPGSIGYPETVVHAERLSQQAILDAIRSGHVFLDLEGSRGRLLEYTASVASRKAEMGDALDVKRGETMRVSIHVVNVAGDSLELIEDGHTLPADDLAARPIGSSDDLVSFDWKGDGARHWIRIVVRTPQGKPLLLGNPIYIDF